ncbi:RagB/SusD family nutrient uptake outer membrane protein [uncultured Bacteroides sp.]|uniref:RagB/SusD family nutrient uptake outer membrane protein n=1 Tax=uncultured Bacteroides sp. TaxID=162156 RepID=UPI002AAABFCE|nr:RagB/SusD family nutrient uptake outer membrane protein [uncultured Bacteroides sp.]
MKFKTISILLLSSLTLASCNDWMDVKSEGTATEASFWKSDKDFSDALVAVYSNMELEETWGRNLFWEQGASDDVFFSRARGNAQMNLANLQMDGSTEGSIKDIYTYMYQMMARSNNIIYNGLKLQSPSTAISHHIGEAYFLRAFSHFMIAYRYGRADNGVPFVRYEDYNPYDDSTIPPQRATVMENYDLIIKDLDKAIERLPWFNEYTANDYGRATKDAAIALKVKTYAYWAQHDKSKWSQIPALVDLLETGGGRGLLDNFADVFTVANEWGKESIWSVNSTGATIAGSIFPGICLDNKGWGRYNGWGNFKPTLELWAEYDQKDLRRPVTIMQYGDEFTFFGEKRKFYSSTDLECGFMFNKYMDPYKYGSVNEKGAGVSSYVSSNGDRPTTDLNVPIMRFGEMLLFKAEALIEQGKGGEAAPVLNRISKRAGMGEPYTNPTIYDLMHERRCELAGEYTDRVMDLKRWAAEGYTIAKTRLESSKHGLKYLNRSDPASALDTTNSVEMTINGKTYKGVIQIMAAKTYDATKGCVLPYAVNEVIKAKGALKQNNGYPSK